MFQGHFKHMFQINKKTLIKTSFWIHEQMQIDLVMLTLLRMASSPALFFPIAKAISED
jgi:hypothetical protein